MSDTAKCLMPDCEHQAMEGFFWCVKHREEWFRWPSDHPDEPEPEWMESASRFRIDMSDEPTDMASEDRPDGVQPEVFDRKSRAIMQSSDGRWGWWISNYRIVRANVPDGWSSSIGRTDEICLENHPARWSEQSLWEMSKGPWIVAISCYNEPRYTCEVMNPDWNGDMYERVEFRTAEEAVAWAEEWMADPEGKAAGCIPRNKWDVIAEANAEGGMDS